MSKLFLTNLGLVLSERCQLSCKHCMRGQALARDMDIETMRKVFNRVSFVGNLNVCGGEPFMDNALFKLLVDTIIETLLPLANMSVVTNGINYTEEMEEQMNKIDEYISTIFQKKSKNCRILLSLDEYHTEQLKHLQETSPLYDTYMENMIRLLHSKYFFGVKGLDRIFDAGRAKHLVDVERIPLKPVQQYYCEKRGVIWHGPMFTVLTDGVVSECDGEFDVLRRDFNYGNVHTDDLEGIIKQKSLKCSRWKFKRLVP